MRLATVTAAVAVAFAAVSIATPADARCTRLGFSVNDYGKDGPIKDAKALLDKYVAKWAADNGIKTYTIGKKDVSCELFLDFIVFDEHTCKATASVCWPDSQGPKTIQVDASAAGTAPKPVTKTAAPAVKKPTAQTGSATADAASPSAPAAAKQASPPEPTATKQ